MVRAALAAVTVFALASGCGFGPDGSDAGVPVYEANIIGPTELEVLTAASSGDDLRAVFDHVRDHRHEGDWWNVTIRCSTIARTDSVDPVLATGRFANTPTGATEGGLASTDDVRFETTGRDNCTPLEPTTPGAVGADEVIAAVEAEGLAVSDVQDGSSLCAELECLRRTVTDVFTVIVWPTPEAAQHWAESLLLDVVVVGPVTTVEFQEESMLPPGAPPGAHQAAVERFAATVG